METNKDYLSISELAKTLGITYQGALKKLRSNKDTLKAYLILDKKKNIKGITQEGLEPLRKLPHRVSYASKVYNENKNKEELLERLIQSKDETIKAKENTIETLNKELEELKAKVKELEAELGTYKQGFFRRLLGYNKQR